MKKSRLIELFQTLEKPELRELKKFVRSPFFNTQKEVSVLADFLINNRDSNKFPPDKPAAFKKIFPDEAYSDVKIRLVMSALLKCLESYLVVKKALAEESDTKIQLAEVYRSRKLSRHFQTTKTLARRSLSSKKERNATFWRQRYALSVEQYYMESAQGRSAALNLQEVTDALDTFFIAEKLRQSCILLTHQAVYKSDYRHGLLAAVLEYLRQYPQMLSEPAVGIYYHAFHALTHAQDEAHFQNFKNQLFSFSEHFPEQELRDLYLLAINYCIRQINEGKRPYFREGFDLYQRGIQNEIFIEKGLLSRFTYSNIVGIGLQLNEFDWVENFLKDYQPFIEKNHRESTFSYNMARLEYARRHFSTAISLLQKAEYKDLLTNLGAKTILLKIFFEQDSTDLLNAHLDAMKNFIRRKRVIGYHRENYLNIVHFTGKLNTVNPFQKSELKKLKEEILSAEPLTEREWLLYQLEEMM